MAWTVISKYNGADKGTENHVYSIVGREMDVMGAQRFHPKVSKKIREHRTRLENDYELKKIISRVEI